MKSLTDFSNTRVLTVLFGVVLLCFIWAGLYVKVQSERQLELDNAVRETSNYARTFEEHTLRTIRGLDQIALFLKHQAESEGLALDLSRLVREGKFANQPFLHLGISDENGNATASSQIPFVNVSGKDLEHFLVHKNIDTGALFIGKPVFGRTTGKWSIQLTRRINKADGSFGGVVFVAVDPNYFLEFYKQVKLGQHSAIALFGRDGIVRVRQSENEVQLGLDYHQRILEKMSASEAGSFSVVAAADGIKRICRRGDRSASGVEAVNRLHHRQSDQ